MCRLPIPWIQASAGMTGLAGEWWDSREGCRHLPSRSRVLGWGRATALHSSWWCWCVGSRDLPSWIPAFAGKTDSPAGATVAGDEPQRYNPFSPPLWIPAPYRGTGHAFDRRNRHGLAKAS